MRDITWYKESLQLMNIKYNILVHNIYVDVREAYEISIEMEAQKKELERLIEIDKKVFNTNDKE